MTLIKSISGIRGTIGGKPGEGLSPVDVVKFTAGYAGWVLRNNKGSRMKIVVGRDSRISGNMVSSLVIATLTGMGLDVVDIGLASTPTTEIAVTSEKAAGGIILTASHNPGQWNALKLLNKTGEFLNAEEGEQVLELAESGDMVFAGIESLGNIIHKDFGMVHIDLVRQLSLVDTVAIRKADFTVAVDGVNSVGGMILPQLLKELGVRKVIVINGEATGNFAHNPEPIPENLIETCETVRKSRADVGFVTDPDVDRLSIICEDGSMFNEEYTLVAVSDYVLSHTPGNTVSNLSSSRALKDVTDRYGCSYSASAVGEVNVVKVMKETGAVIGGEGNGGVIYPASHYGRDALVGVALFLSHLARSGLTCSGLRKTYPDYFIAKKKIGLTAGIDINGILMSVKDHFRHEKITTIDGLKIDLENSWVHLRKSNTEPIIRIYAEAKSQKEADELAGNVISLIKKF